MIFVSVGMQLPFDRFVRLIDEIAPDLPCPVFAQTGNGRYRPINMEWRASLSQSDFERTMRLAGMAVAHAGIGTVLTAQRLQTPLVLFPRRQALGEHRNDHQIASARVLQGRPGIAIAWNAANLRDYMLRPERIASTQLGKPTSVDRLKAMLTERFSAGNRGRKDALKVKPRRPRLAL